MLVSNILILGKESGSGISGGWWIRSDLPQRHHLGDKP
jgi:hypothetical protein